MQHEADSYQNIICKLKQLVLEIFRYEKVY